MTQTQKLQQAIRATLVEADDLYTLMIEAGESPNIDSVGYTSDMMLDQFRALLGRPDLHVEELAHILRQAREEVRRVMGPRAYTRVPKPVQAPDPDHAHWSYLMARIVATSTNENDDAIPVWNRKIG